MNRVLAIAAVCAVAVSTPAWAGLAVGAKAPDITAKAYENGNPSNFHLADALKKGPVVLYFFPGAFTPGCNVEAQQFAASIDKYKAAGAQVIGVTGGFGNTARSSKAEGGLEEAVRDFSKEHCNGKFPVAAVSVDTIKAYGVELTQRPGWSNRTSYVIDKSGNVVMAFENLSPDGHVDKTLAAVQALKK
ncbi:MAG TPA: redoxin domain-containing protein [Caulobacteraceae bacterium]|nr:redoxin domain-containing protein [Caulobacteraceae bacterium]